MSAIIVDQYTFSASAKTITFPQYSNLRLEGVKLITNLNTGTIIYQFNDVAKKGTVSSNILTLVYDTTAMSNTDKLMIIYEEVGGGIFNRVTQILYQLLELVRSPSYMALLGSGDAIRVVFDGNSAMNTVNGVTTVTTVSTTTNLTNLNTVDSRNLIWGSWENEYLSGIRSRIT